MKKGVDVSTFQGAVNWEEIAKNVDFAIIRAGYGRNNIDARAVENFEGARAVGLPVGAYWFSYALSAEEARKEFDYLRSVAGDTELPLFLDYEGESLDYANRQGVDVDPEELAQAFFDRAEECGARAGIYCNLDYFRNYFQYTAYPYLWLAQWEVDVPSVDCDIWQYTSKGQIQGVSTLVDLNGLMNDAVLVVDGADIESLALATIAGKYGNGAYRKQKLGKNYAAVQNRINEYYNAAKDVIRGLYGNGTVRKDNLKKAGYDYATVQSIVNAVL